MPPVGIAKVDIHQWIFRQSVTVNILQGFDALFSLSARAPPIVPVAEEKRRGGAFVIIR